MIRQKFTFNDWTVYAFYDASTENRIEILELLDYVGCNRKHLKDILYNIEDGLTDNGFVYSNCVKHESVLVIGKGSSAEEAINTLAHEIQHLKDHITKTLDIDQDSEESYYIVGKLMQLSYNAFKRTLT